jgi:hypothetical protein
MRNLFFFACAAILSVTGFYQIYDARNNNLRTHFTSIQPEVIRKNIHSFSNISSANENTSHIAFIDIDGCLLSYAGLADEKDIITQSTLSELNRLQKSGIVCIALTARSPRNAEATTAVLKKHGIQFNGTSLAPILQELGEAYHNGIIFSKHIRRKNEDKIKPTKPRGIQTVLTMIKKHGITFSQVTFIDDKLSNFKGIEDVDFSDLGLKTIKLYFYQRTFEPIFENSELPNLDLTTLKLVEVRTNDAGRSIIVEDKNGRRWSSQAWKTKQKGILGSRDGLLYNDLPESFKKQKQLKKFLKNKGYFSFIPLFHVNIESVRKTPWSATH